ncbi:hypothetical protein [Bradyrhizobium sp. dw_411]|uniref:hypothetical protein n=1 Tax=Bradyrhizobium sp. dw_411 TaxID=2720082 RepID=UPI001BCEEAFC|nr:hypothetical protein [Bradyrhizobium sp. dw_411]
MTSASAANNNPRGRRAGSLTRLLQRIGAACGIIVAGVGADPSSAPAEGVDYRAANAVPASWQDFAKQLQARFQERLAADDAAARKFQDGMAKREAGADAASTTLAVRAWILPDGKIERVEVDGLSDDAAMNLRVLLARGKVGAPPPDMLQPLHLRLRVQPKDQPN